MTSTLSQPAQRPDESIALAGHRVLVVGASRGLGAVVGATVRNAGAQVVGTSRNHTGGHPDLVTMDVTSAASVGEGTAAAVELLGGLDGLVVNAGISSDGVLHEQDPDRMREMFEVNVLGAMLAYQAAAPHLRRSSLGPSIVFISSVMAAGGVRGAGCYAATKAAVNSLARTAASELGREGIRVNAVTSGFLSTGMGEALMDDERLYTHYRKRIALAEFGDPQSVARAVCFLLSPAADYITGALVPVDGGARP